MNVRLIPLGRNSKKPLAGESWKDRLSDDPAQHLGWLRNGLNVGFPLQENGVSCVDFDEKIEARNWWNMHKDIVGVAVVTRRGIHAYFAGTTQTRKVRLADIKGNGYTVFPPSRVGGHQYRFVTGHEWGNGLLPFPEDLFPRSLRVDSRSTHNLTDGIRDVRRYIRGIRALSGSGGHNATFRVACCLRDAGLSESEALAEMVMWNETNAEPLWTVKELLHKVRSAYVQLYI